MKLNRRPFHLAKHDCVVLWIIWLAIAHVIEHIANENENSKLRNNHNNNNNNKWFFFGV